jgi:hypothetical protein
MSQRPRRSAAEYQEREVRVPSHSAQQQTVPQPRFNLEETLAALAWNPSSPQGGTASDQQATGANLLAFLDQLGCRIEVDGALVWARRMVAGEDVLAAFAAINSSDPEDLRRVRKELHKAGRREPGAKLHLITGARCRLSHEQIDDLTDIDIKVDSEIGYLHSTVRSVDVCNLIISEAEAYIPEAAYVEQKLAPDGSAADAFLDDWLGAGDQGLVVVLGHAGHGKTCLANHLARKLARRHLEKAVQAVPFLLTLHRHRHVQHFDELVLTHLQDRGIHGLTSSAFAFLINVGCVVPILDGFDELAETGGLRVARETLRGLLSRIHPGAKVLVTSRQAYFRHQGDLSLFGQDDLLANLQTAELQPFDEQQRRSFLHLQGLNSDSIKQIESHISELGAAELLASPLMLKILGTEARESPNDGPLYGSSATEVLDLCIKRICEREKPKGREKWESGHQLAFLTGIADLMYEENSFELQDSDDWLRDILMPDVPKGITRAKQQEEVDARVLQLKNHPLLCCTVVHDCDAVEFRHPLFRDFLLARQFKQKVTNDAYVRQALRHGLSDSTCRFLADLLTSEELARLFDKCHGWIELSRDLWECLLLKCDKVSKSDAKTRTAEMERCLGGRRTFDYDSLSRLRFCLLNFKNFTFLGTDLTRSSFQKCELEGCTFNSARIGGCRFYDCTADEQTGANLASLGVSVGSVRRTLLGLGRAAVSVQNDDPVFALVIKFFQRFIRGGPGQHQKTAKADSMLKGLGGEERKFTERELIPAMKREAVVSESMASSGTAVFVFNSDWQADGDSILNGEATERLGQVIERLRGKSDRYNLM